MQYLLDLFNLLGSYNLLADCRFLLERKLCRGKMGTQFVGCPWAIQFRKPKGCQWLRCACNQYVGVAFRRSCNSQWRALFQRFYSMTMTTLAACLSYVSCLQNYRRVTPLHPSTSSKFCHHSWSLSLGHFSGIL